MDGILEKYMRDAASTPERPLYDFLDCGTEPYRHNRVTIGEAWRHAMDMAAELRQKGAKPGDRAIILSMQDAGTVYAVWGCMIAGVVFTVIPPPIDEGKLNRFVSVLKSSKPRFLISNAGMEREAETNVTGPLLKKAFLNVVTLKRVYTDQVKPAQTGEVTPHKAEDLLYLQYTSGSTSAPKGVMVTYGNLMGCIGQCLEIFDFQHTSNNLASWVPFYHNIGLIVAIFLPVIADTGVSYFIPTLQFLARPTVWLRVLSDYKVNITAAPNSAYEVCTRLITPEEAKKYDLSHVTHLINGSEFVNAATVEKFCALFGITPDCFAPGYGLSECVCVGTLASRDYRCQHIDLEAYREGRFLPAPEGEKAIVSVGRPAGDMVLVAIRPDGTPCEPGEIGEICIQGSSVCAGYWQNPEETKRFQTVIPGYGGQFYRTGDMGVVYEGQLYLTGRIKEMIIISGKNIFPGDITLLLRQEGVPLPADAMAVFSVQAVEGECPVLCAECAPGADFAAVAAEVNRLTARNFDFSFRDIVFVPSGTLPRTDNRKIKTLATRAMYEAGELPVLYSSRRQGTAAASAKKSEPAPRQKVTLPPDATPEQIQPIITGIFREVLPGVTYGPEDSFLELGGDSLRMMELVCDLEHDLGVNIDIRCIAAEPTVSGISNYLSALLAGREKEFQPDLRAECVLPEEIAPQGEYTNRPEDCRTVFLTGSTGFLGAYLIRALIEQRGEKGIQIYCHARAATPEKALGRVIDNMKRFQCWQDRYLAYLHAVPGDLTQPHLGMSEADWNQMSKEVDAIYHNGAVLNFVFPYRQMKPANVLGTTECLRLACEGKLKYFHYVSSYSVYDNPSHFDRTVMEDDPLESPDGYFLGYSETKWVAEKLVGLARQRGLRAAVYRPGDITGTLSTGIWKLEDLISRSLVGCVQLGAAPDVEVNLHLTPVDYVADALVYISFQSLCCGHAFNLLNHRLMPLQQMTALIKKAGYPLERLPYGEWCERLTATTSEENVLRILSCLFTDQRSAGEDMIARFGAHQAQFSTANTDRLLAGSGITCPPVNAALLQSYLRYYIKNGYLPAPQPWWKRLFSRSK